MAKYFFLGGGGEVLLVRIDLSKYDQGVIFFSKFEGLQNQT